MADSSATYTLNFDGNFVDGAGQSVTAAQALDAQLQSLGASAKVATPGVTGLGAGAGAAASKVKAAGVAVGDAGKVAKVAKLDVGALGGALAQTGGAAGGAASKGIGLVSTLSKLGNPAVIAAVGLVALTVAAVAATVALTQMSIAASDAARAQLLFAAAATGSVAAGGELAAWASKLSDRTRLSTAAIRDLGLGLARAGVQGHVLGATMEAASIATSAFGDGAGAKIASIAEEAVKLKARFIGLTDAKLLGSGVNVNDVAKALATRMKVGFATAKAAILAGRVETSTALDAVNDAVKVKFGAIAELQSQGIGVQMAKLAANFTELFSGVDVGPLGKGLKDTLSVLGQNTVAGRGLKAAFTGIAQPLIDGLTALLPLGKQVIYGMIIGALQLAIVVAKVRNAFVEGFATDKVTLVKVAVYGVAIAIGAVVAVVVAAAGVIAAAVAVGVAAFVALGAAVYLIYSAFAAVGGAIVGFWDGLDFAAIGSNLITGLVNGIKSGASAVYSAIKEIGAGIVTTLSSDLQIHSPSVVFHGLGMNTALGFAQGVDAGAPEADRSVSNMVSVPASSVAPKPSGGARGAISVTFGDIIINGAPAPKDVARSIVGELERALLGLGASPEPEPA